MKKRTVEDDTATGHGAASLDGTAVEAPGPLGSVSTGPNMVTYGRSFAWDVLDVAWNVIAGLGRWVLLSLLGIVLAIFAGLIAAIFGENAISTLFAIVFAIIVTAYLIRRLFSAYRAMKSGADDGQ